MALGDSILKGIKKDLGLDENYDAFDHDVLTQINSAFFTLYQLGLGPVDGFTVEGDAEKWVNFTGTGVNKMTVMAVHNFIYLSTRLVFDPPQFAHHLKAMQDQVQELTYRLKAERELAHANVQIPDPVETAPQVLDGGVL